MFCAHCGRYLPDESRFCPNCGASLVKEEVKEPEINQVEDYSQQVYSQQPYSQQTYSQQIYIQQPQDSTQNQYLRYKKKVAPFKIISGVLNLLTLLPFGILALALLGVGMGVEGLDIVEKVNSGLLDKFTVCGIACLIFSVILFIVSIVAMIVPAKAGVICNLVSTVCCTILLIWAIVLNIDLGSVANEFNKWGFSSSSTQVVSDMSLGLYVFIFGVGILQFISLVLSLIGMAIKKR